MKMERKRLIGILWINPVGTQVFDDDTLRILDEAKRADTHVDVVSLPGSAITSQKIPDIEERFHQIHEQNYSFRLVSLVEAGIYHFTAFGRVKMPALRKLDRVGGILDDVRKGERRINFVGLITPE
jgi:N-methylhydantoinase A